MGARWYNPSTATFRSRDTYMGRLRTPFSLNRYTYGLNNPLRYNDPTGHSSQNLTNAELWDLFQRTGTIPDDHPFDENPTGAADPQGTADLDYSYVLPGSASKPEDITQPDNPGPAPSSTASPGATASTGNLSYTPRALSEEEILTLFRQGNTPNAIADSWTDARYIYRMSAAGTAGKVAAGSQVVAAAGAATCVETAGAGCVVAGAAEVVALAAETVVVVSSLWDLINGPAKAKAAGDGVTAETPAETARKRGAELVDQYKKAGEGTGVGRSGGGGEAKKKAGAELIREGNKLPKGALKDAYKKQGNRLINQGNADSHPGNP
jgi:hypothetical protein